MVKHGWSPQDFNNNQIPVSKPKGKVRKMVTIAPVKQQELILAKHYDVSLRFTFGHVYCHHMNSSLCLYCVKIRSLSCGQKLVLEGLVRLLMFLIISSLSPSEM